VVVVVVVVVGLLAWPAAVGMLRVSIIQHPKAILCFAETKFLFFFFSLLRVIFISLFTDSHFLWSVDANGNIILGPPPTVSSGSFPPQNAQGQRICRQCGLPGRYKDGKCVEKWGPGPEGPGTVCDRFVTPHQLFLDTVT
jgi:hypothetical protein